MKLSLTKCGNIEYENHVVSLAPQKGRKILDVQYCAICRTDAKMWQQGHRDLALPRILGHEIAAFDSDTGTMYTVWPGQSCGHCYYCKNNRENLCDDMKIIGFHSDGGFADKVSVPESSLIKITTAIQPHLLTFAEPLGCIFNGLSPITPQVGNRLIIYGGGVVGMLAAAVVKSTGCDVIVIEKSQKKIDRLISFSEKLSISVLKDTVESDFDYAINCCDSHIAFMLCITKLRKGGKLCYFSGLKKNEEIETNLLNLLHYKEIELHGAYGPRKSHMIEGLQFLSKHQDILELLVEQVIHPAEVKAALPQVLTGSTLKYIIDFTGKTKATATVKQTTTIEHKNDSASLLLSPFLESIMASITIIDPTIRSRAQEKVDGKTKPLGALGKLEKLAVQIASIQNNLNPKVDNKRLFTFAGDHGVVEEGVSAFPAKVTIQMVENFLVGGAAINVFCHQYGIELSVIDMGVNGDFDKHKDLIKKKVAYGTNNFSIEDAMSKEQAIQALDSGAQVFMEKFELSPCELVGMGEMGIGNTTSATAIISAATGIPINELVGRGTGVDDKGLERKINVLEKAMTLHSPENSNGFEILRKVGGYEIAGMAGAILAAAAKGSCIVLDGIISTSAGLIAYLLCPTVKEYLVSGHKSVERGQLAALEIMGIEPILDLDLRLGEGTGAAITMNLIDLSCSMIRNMATFEEAEVDRSEN